MAKQKLVYLGIVHVIQMKAPEVHEIINNPMYEEELKEQIKKLKNKASLHKAVKKVANKHIKKVKTEYVYITDSINSKALSTACIIIDVDNKKVVRNRFKDADEVEMVDLYMQRYADKIQEFFQKFRVSNV